MQTTLKHTLPPLSVPFDDQIRAIIPHIVPWLARANIWNHDVEREFPLDPSGYYASDYGNPNVRERASVLELIAFLETSIGGRAEWKNPVYSPSQRCEIKRPSFTGPSWWVSFRNLQRPATSLASQPNFQPSIELIYWNG